MNDHPKFPANRKRSYAGIELEAQATRRAMGFDPEQPLPSILLFEKLELLRTGEHLEIPATPCVELLVEGVEAETRYNPLSCEIEVVLAEETYSELEEEQPRARFSVAHEVGHVVQHHAELVRLSKIPRTAAALMRGRYAAIPIYEDVEWQADAFGGAYLAPAKALWRLEVGRRLSLDEIARRFGMSKSAASKRLEVYEKRKTELVK